MVRMPLPTAKVWTPHCGAVYEPLNGVVDGA
jgi:hypothetical protein